MTIKTEEMTKEILNMKLIDLMCKHVLRRNNANVAEKVLRFATEYCKYPYCLWGIHDGHENDLNYHINRIHKMELDNFSMPIRIVKCKYQFSDKEYYWADNLHFTVKAIRKHGKKATLENVDLYIVDITDLSNVKLIDYNRSIRENFREISNIVQCAYDRYAWSNNSELIELEYTVKDFLNDNPELYTCFNTNIGLINEGDSIPTIIEKAQAFNSLYNISKCKNNSETYN